MLLPDVGPGIGDNTAFVDETVDAVSGHVNSLEHLVELTLETLESCLRGANSSSAPGSLSDLEKRVLLRLGDLVDVIYQLGVRHFEKSGNALRTSECREGIAELIRGSV